MKRVLLLVGVLLSVSYIQMIGQRAMPNKGVSMGASDKMVNIGLSEQVRKGVAEKLNLLLANEYALYVKTQKHHWNLVGPFFGPLHKLFNDQYDALALVVDEVAERVRTLGYKPYGTLTEFAQHATIPEEPGKDRDANSMIKDLLEGHETVIRQLREDIDYTAQVNEMGSNNFLADLIEQHEKTAWILRAHLL